MPYPGRECAGSIIYDKLHACSLSEDKARAEALMGRKHRVNVRHEDAQRGLMFAKRVAQSARGGHALRIGDRER